MTALSRPSVNPFQSASPDVTPAEAEHVAPTFTTKPWGHELRFADGRHRYVGKLINVVAGQ